MYFIEADRFKRVVSTNYGYLINITFFRNCPFVGNQTTVKCNKTKVKYSSLHNLSLIWPIT